MMRHTFFLLRVFLCCLPFFSPATLAKNNSCEQYASEQQVGFSQPENSPGYSEYEMALDYQQGGNGKLKDLEKAIEIYSSSANLGYLPAYYALGTIYWLRVGTADGKEKGFEWFSKLDKLEADYSTAYILGLMYLRGEGVAMDKARAFSFLRKASRLGNTNAQLLLANELERTGNLNATEAEEVFCLYSSAAKTESEAQYKVGLYLERLSDVNRATALEWYCKAFNQNDESALGLLSKRYGGYNKAKQICKKPKKIIVNPFDKNNFHLKNKGIIGDRPNAVHLTILAVQSNR